MSEGSHIAGELQTLLSFALPAAGNGALQWRYHVAGGPRHHSAALFSLRPRPHHPERFWNTLYSPPNVHGCVFCGLCRDAAVQEWHWLLFGQGGAVLLRLYPPSGSGGIGYEPRRKKSEKA